MFYSINGINQRQFELTQYIKFFNIVNSETQLSLNLSKIVNLKSGKILLNFLSSKKHIKHLKTGKYKL